MTQLRFPNGETRARSVLFLRKPPDLTNWPAISRMRSKEGLIADLSAVQ